MNDDEKGSGKTPKLVKVKDYRNVYNKYKFFNICRGFRVGQSMEQICVCKFGLA